MPDEQPIDDDSNNANNDKTRRYPWGIQQLVSTHQLAHKGEVLQTNSYPKS